MELEEKTVASETVWRGKILYVTKDIALLPNGEKTQRDVIHHNGGVGIIPLCDNGDILMVKQFRYPMNEITLEIPAGKREGKEEPIDCGTRELKEETGCTAERIIDLGKIYPTPAYDKEVIHLFLATGIKQVSGQNLDDNEFINVERVSLRRAYSMVMNGKIKDAKTQIGILKVHSMSKERRYGK